MSFKDTPSEHQRNLASIARSTERFKDHNDQRETPEDKRARDRKARLLELRALLDRFNPQHTQTLPTTIRQVKELGEVLRLVLDEMIDP